MKTLKEYAFSIVLFAAFEAVAVTLWLVLDDIFYLFNFTYIGACLALGTALFSRRVSWARRAVQLAVGSYMLVYLGILCGENMQLEGFWYYLFLGVFQAAVIHYAVAKLFGPLLFGRGWCGFACWTAMVLDFLPWKHPAKPRRKLRWPRYVLFFASLCYVAALFAWKVPDLERVMARSFLVGNALSSGRSSFPFPSPSSPLSPCITPWASAWPGPSGITGRFANMCAPSPFSSSP